MEQAAGCSWAGSAGVLKSLGGGRNAMRQGLIALGLAVAFLANLAGAAIAAETYDIHVILPLTGNGAFLGQGHRDSLDTLAEIVNKANGIDGRPVRFVYHDDQS